jgi:hypothetical protein
MIIGRGETVHYYKMIFVSVFASPGSVALHRRGDGIVLNSESPLLFSASAVSFPLNTLRQGTGNRRNRPRAAGEFNQLVAQHNLWEHFSKLLIYTASRVYEHCAQISQMSAYDIIRFQLVELMQEPDAIRLNTTAAPISKAEPIFHAAELCVFWRNCAPGSTSPWSVACCSTFTICHENIAGVPAREKRYN